MGQDLLVVLECRQESPKRQIDAPRLVTCKLLVPEINLMDDLGQLREPLVFQAAPAEQRFEGTILSLMAESTPAASKGTASAGKSFGEAKTKSASGSMNRLISHADATRST